MTKTDVKIKPCPYCGAECIVQEELFPPIVECTGCQYYAHSEETPAEAIASHNRHWEYVRLGKAAKAFCENPPEPEENTEGDEFCDGYEAGEKDGIKKCLDRLQEKGGE